MNWLKELPVGGKFLDQSRTFIGVITHKDDNSFTWQWRFVSTGRKFKTHKDQYSGYDDDALVETGWIPLTPLLEVLL